MVERTDSSNFKLGRWLASPTLGEEVVISGMSGRLPNSRNIQEYCEHLFKKEEMVDDDHRRWKLNHPEIPQRSAKIYDIDRCDAAYFGLHYRQAQSMDPMLRTLLETTIEAIMDAGLNPTELEGTNTAVYICCCWLDRETETLCQLTEAQKFGITGCLRNFLARRISYFLKLKNHSFIADTACSSYLTALDTAFKAIRTGNCDNAIVGCGNIILHPGSTLQFSRLGVLSMDGVCRVFDQDAKGYVRGETVGCLFLQKAKNSRRVYATIINTKSNSDGYKDQGITFPSTQMQHELIKEIYEDSNILPDELSYLEAHGTGTQVGDSQEVDAIDLSIAKKRSKQLLVGSVKSSVGHTEAASGFCSIVKVLLAMETGFVTPNINLKKIKKGMKSLEEGRMKVVTELTKLDKNDSIIGINNFGFGGSNSHIILKRFSKTKNHNERVCNNIPRLVCVSGRTEAAVQKLLNDVQSNRFDYEYMGLLHQINKKNVKGHLYRGYSITSRDETKTSLSFYNPSKSLLYIFLGKFVENFDRLGQYLIQFTIFQDVISRINSILVSKSIKPLNFYKSSTLNYSEKILGSLCVQVGVVEMLKELEIFPAAAYANSYGKLIASYYYNVFSLEETIYEAIKVYEQNLKCDVKFDYNPEKEFKSKKCLNDAFNIAEVIKMAKHNVILNLSDFHLNKYDMLLVENKEVSFLESLGKIFEVGYNPQIHKLYPEIQFPVSRGTSMISPSIQWLHEKSWHTYRFTRFTTKSEQLEHVISHLRDEYKYLLGHVIDGRLLFPATEYLNLVWQTFAEMKRRTVTEFPVVFFNCKLIRAVNMPETSYVKFLVSIHKGTGKFEVFENGFVVVHGYIYEYDNSNTKVKMVDLEPIPFVTDNPREVLEHDDIYRELYLRGYNYSGSFKGIQKSNIESTAALIKWENNWSTFMDKMLQLKILQNDSRLLFVPIGIKRLILNPKEHLRFVEKFSNEPEVVLPTFAYKDCNIIKSGGIEICGLQAKSISKKKQRLEPILEKYVFIANCCHLNLSDAIRVNVQIILENNLETNFKAVELLDDFCSEEKFILEFVSKALDDVPVVNPNLTVSTKNESTNIPGVKFEPVALTPDSRILLIVGSKILGKEKIQNQIITAIKNNGYILTREAIDSKPVKLHNMEIVTEFTTSNEKLILIRKNDDTQVKPKFIEILSNTWEWLPQLRESLLYDQKIILFSTNKNNEGLLGFVNCIRREPHGDKITCFFMMDDCPDFDITNRFYNDQLNKNFAINVYKNKSWGTYRHLLLEPLSTIQTKSYFANVSSIGDFASLKWFENGLFKETSLSGKACFISNYYAAINFKDVMCASGRVNIGVSANNRIEQECVIGFEFAGKDLKGRRVIGINNCKSIANNVVGYNDFLWEIPDTWSFEEGATVPVVYSTVMYALFLVHNLKVGSSILIHSATGGIGLAALNICTYYKCDIYVTIGTQDKREFLKKHYPHIPESHFGNSHNTSFEEMINIQTNKRGVDIVLNSLSEDKLKASIRCLAQGGSFLEIGKFDLANDADLDLLFMERRASYHGIMLDNIFATTNQRKTTLFNLINEGIRSGTIKPLPYVIFEKNQVENAFRYMMTGKHIGKVLIKIKDETRTDVPREKNPFRVYPKFYCEPQYSYIILGGLGGFGLELADWLVLQGAKKIILVSRFGIQTGYQVQRINYWKSYNVDVQISTKDVTTKQGCIDLIDEANNMGPVMAVFNLAVVLKDALFEDQTSDNFVETFAPKAQATIHLDQITRELCPYLRYFVVFSSVSCGRGNAGQTNYGMANSVMERICERRRSEGLPGLAIQWGAIGDVGLVAKMQKENKELVIGGTLQQKISSCKQVLDRFLRQDNPVVSSMLVAEKHERITTNSAVDAVAFILGIRELKTISRTATLAELGLDSLMGAEVIQILEKEFDIFVTAKDIRNLTFEKLFELEKNQSSDNKLLPKSEKGTNAILQYLPDEETADLKIVELNNFKSKDINTVTAFLLPGVEGVFTPFESFTKNIEAKLIGLVYSYDKPENTIQELAANILPNIEDKVSKDNLFILIGYSYGAVVALHIASLLENKGYRGKVILIDGSPTYLKTLAIENLPFEDENKFQTAFIFKIFSILLPLNLLNKNEEKFLSFGNLEERLDFAFSLIPNPSFKKKIGKIAAMGIYKRYKSIMTYQYNDRKIESNVYLIKAKYSVSQNKDYGLEEICESLNPVLEVEGDHASILNQEELMQVVNKIIN